MEAGGEAAPEPRSAPQRSIATARTRDKQRAAAHSPTAVGRRAPKIHKNNTLVLHHKGFAQHV